MPSRSFCVWIVSTLWMTWGMPSAASATSDPPGPQVWVGHEAGQPTHRVSLTVDGERVVFVDVDRVVVGHATHRVKGPGSPDGRLDLEVDLTVERIVTFGGRRVALKTSRAKPAQMRAAIQLMGDRGRMCATAPGSNAKRPGATPTKTPDKGVRCWTLQEVPPTAPAPVSSKLVECMRDCRQSPDKGPLPAAERDAACARSCGASDAP